MSHTIATAVTLLKGFTALWSLITLILSGIALKQVHDYQSRVGSIGKFSGGGGVIAAAVLDMINFSIVTGLILFRPHSMLISFQIDVILLAALSFFTIGMAATLSDQFGVYKLACVGSCQGGMSIGQAALAFVWILAFLILGIWLTELISVLRRFGADSKSGRIPFNELMKNGHRSVL